MDLKRIQGWIKNFLGSIYEVCNNNDATDIRYTCSLINAISDSEELHFSKQDIYSIINYLDKRTVVNMNVCYWSGDLVLNACIRYNNYRFWIYQWYH